MCNLVLRITLRRLTASVACAFFVLSSRAFASGFDLGIGSITTHVNVGPGYHNYCNQIDRSDVIANPTAFARVEGQHSVVTAMVGQDSICSPIQGLFYSYKVYETKWFGLAFLVGGYHFDYQNWLNEENNVPPGKVAVAPVYTTIGKTFYFVPVGGVELDIALAHWDRDHWSLNFNTVLTPIIIPTFISLKYTF